MNQDAFSGLTRAQSEDKRDELSQATQANPLDQEIAVILNQLPELQSVQNQLAEIEAIDYFIAREMVCALVNVPDAKILAFSEIQIATLFHLFMALSQAQRHGHTCLQLSLLSAQHWFVSSTDGEQEQQYDGYVFPDFNTLLRLVNVLPISADNDAMVVFDNDSLYLRRYWLFERELADAITQRVANANEIIESQINDQKQRLTQLFPESLQNDIDWQKVAVANALNKSFSIIAGGPGTGKTYTVTKLIAALLMQADKTLDIQLVAPTGKAAQRLSESISAAVESFRKSQLIEEQILNQIPTIGLTLHRLLGVIPNSPNFRHDKQNLLHCDVVIVDEVSMVDLPLMTRLFRALPTTCKVVLLGDCQQLPSVETGSVLADLAPHKTTRFSTGNGQYLAQVCAESFGSEVISLNESACDYLTYLTQSRRFTGSGGIGLLAKAIIAGDSLQAWQLLANNTEQLRLSKESSLASYLVQLTNQHYLPVFQSDNLQQAYQAFQQFRILSPCKSGEGGVESINEQVEKELQSKGFIHFSQALYRGRPIMITQNHYKLQLFNGDIGMLWPDQDGNLKAYFPSGDGFRQVSIPRLPPFETVYAMTIHKTQGSEFDQVAMVIPQQGSAKLLTRELLYTGLTRAKSHFQLFSRKKEFTEGVNKQVRRCSGLEQRML
ncbi:exodeoxyribonuclease V subunit alpha [Thalassotalea litorea]|uniref:RecBCD enzyme subunit RecD n=1 Tax=Thalassotalea litorea TaxID=2020715 RepID=A0A5R9ISH0_9GAMM|nr:exodeoxyribonuclease V subunit alpha [Thalassotalea litorea]TLU66241.1 exodeoxyribonuclease V subunit alpha [Thalassotalea litorea]